MVRRVDDAYILRLDELPKVVEADGTVYPVVLPLREAARLFHVAPLTLEAWIEKYEIPLCWISRKRFIEVAVLGDFIREHTYTSGELHALYVRRRIAKQQAHEMSSQDDTEGALETM